MAHNAGECLRAYVDAVNSGSADKTFDLLKDATLKVPHGTTEQETMKGEQVKTWLDHRINQQHVKVQLAGEIKVEGDTAMAEMRTSGDMIPQDDFPQGFSSRVTITCGSNGNIQEFHAEPKAEEWNGLVEKRRATA